MNDSSATDWIERPRAAWLAVWPIALTALRLVFRRKLFWLMLGFALLNFLFVFGAIYLLATLKAQQPEIGKMLSVMLPDLAGTGKTFLNFMFAQGTVTMILLAFAGSVLAGNDHLRGGLTFYLSRRINVLHYTGGKLLAIGLLVSLTTTLPALVLFLEQGMLGDTAKYFGEKLQHRHRHPRLRPPDLGDAWAAVVCARVLDAPAGAAGDVVGLSVLFSACAQRDFEQGIRRPAMAVAESLARHLRGWQPLFRRGGGALP